MKSKVSIVKCSSYDAEEVYKAVKKSIDDIGFKLQEGSKVLIKPNILSQYRPEDYITTHPAVIDAACRILKEKCCRIIIGESSGWYMDGGTRLAMRLSGIEEVAKKNDALLIPFEEAEVKKISNDNAKILKEMNIASPLFDVDLVINMPKMKTHELMVFTGAVKNLLGCMPGGLKQKCHIIAKDDKEFGHLLLDIYQNIMPGLNIMDGVVGLEGEGPGAGGTPKKTGLILASESAVALDIIAEKITGMSPDEIFTTKYAVERGLFPGYESIEVIGELATIPYKKPKRFAARVPGFLKDFAFKQAMVFPLIDKEICKRCMKCVSICPVKTIKVENNVVFVDKKGCINCYCCHEMCPYNAIELKSSRLIGMVRGFRNRLSKKK